MAFVVLSVEERRLRPLEVRSAATLIASSVTFQPIRLRLDAMAANNMTGISGSIQKYADRRHCIYYLFILLKEHEARRLSSYETVCASRKLYQKSHHILFTASNLADRPTPGHPRLYSLMLVVIKKYISTEYRLQLSCEPRQMVETLCAEYN